MKTCASLRALSLIHIYLLKLKPGQTTFDLRRLMRPIVVIPEAMPVPKALRLMQQRHVQMVLVADEYGGTAGLITMEDLVEEIVGDIQDAVSYTHLETAVLSTAVL